MELFKKKHTSEKAMNDHSEKIKKRGGVYRIKGNVIEYGFPEKDKDTSIQSRTITDLIKEAATKNYKKVRVVFVPAYEKELHSNLKNKELIDSLKKSKVETFDVIEEASDIIKLLNNKDVKSIHFV